MKIDRETLAKIKGFQWDQSNVKKNWDKHSVLFTECEEVFFNEPLIIAPHYASSQGEPRFVVLGRTDLGRHLFIAFTIRDEQIRVISARDMSRKERRHYP